MCELKFEVIEQINEMTVKNGKKKYYYYSLVKCKDCGYTKKIYRNDVRFMKECKQCNLQKHKDEFVGFENQQYKVVDFSHQTERRLFYKVVCKKCNSIITMRKDAIVDSTKISCIKCKSNGITPSLKAPMNVYMYYYMSGAKQRHLEWELSKEEFENIVSKDCHYCGEDPRPLKSLARYHKVDSEIHVNGIDRIDNEVGYTLNNCVPCCTKCNIMKMKLSKSNFLNQVLKIASHIQSSTTIPKGSTLQANGSGSRENPEKGYDIV